MRQLWREARSGQRAACGCLLSHEIRAGLIMPVRDLVWDVQAERLQQHGACYNMLCPLCADHSQQQLHAA